MGDIVDSMHSEARALMTGEAVQAAWIHIPLDIARSGVRSLPWRPFVLSELTVSGQEDLVLLVNHIRGLQRHTGHDLVLLSDMTIHYRIAKLIYGESCHQLRQQTLNTDSFVGHVPSHMDCLSFLAQNIVKLRVSTYGHSISLDSFCALATLI